jgi:hypothetical protein
MSNGRNNTNESFTGEPIYTEGVVYSDGAVSNGINNGPVGQILTSTGTNSAPQWAPASSFPGAEGIIYNNGLTTTTIPTTANTNYVLTSNGTNPIWEPLSSEPPPGIGLFYSPDGTNTTAITNGPTGSFLKMVAGAPAFSFQADGLIESKAGQLSNVPPTGQDSICISNASNNFFMIPVTNGLIQHTASGFGTLSTSGNPGDICMSNSTGQPSFIVPTNGVFYKNVNETGISGSHFNTTSTNQNGAVLSWDGVGTKPTFQAQSNGIVYTNSGLWNYVTPGADGQVLIQNAGAPVWGTLPTGDIPDPLYVNNVDERTPNSGVGINNNITVFSGTKNGIQYAVNTYVLAGSQPTQMNTYVSSSIGAIMTDSQTTDIIGTLDVYVNKIGGMVFITLGNLTTSNLLNNSSYVVLGNIIMNGDYRPQKDAVVSNFGIIPWKNTSGGNIRLDTYVSYDPVSRLFSFKSNGRSDGGFNNAGSGFSIGEFTFSFLGKNN